MEKLETGKTNWVEAVPVKTNVTGLEIVTLPDPPPPQSASLTVKVIGDAAAVVFCKKNDRLVKLFRFTIHWEAEE